MERNRSFDIAKGIAIILVVLGHTYSFSDGNVILYLLEGFHMPFFFIVSGILYGQKCDSLQGYRLKLSNKAKTLLVPYFVWEILFLLYLCLAEHLAGGLTVEFAVRKLFSVINLAGLHSTWFLPCLLVVQILFRLFSRTGKLPCAMITACLAVFGLLCPDSDSYMAVLLRCFVAMAFFAIGFFASEWWQRSQKPLVVMLAAAVYCVFAWRNGLVNLVSCTFHNPLLYVGNALLGTFVLLQLAMCLLRIGNYAKVTSFLEYIGRYSIIILCTHAFIIEFFRLVDYKLFHNFLPRLGYFEGLLFTALILFTEIPVMVIGRRYVPAVFGIRKKEQK